MKELRVYQKIGNPIGKRPLYQMILKQEVRGPSEYFVTAPLVGTFTEAPGLVRPLPLGRVERFGSEAPKEGVWLNAHGRRSQGNVTILHGYILHYNPERNYLGILLKWTSPAGKLPEWREIVGGGTPELAIDRTIGMEPDFQVYQVQPWEFILDPIRLAAISIREPVSDAAAYRDALRLAENGLWSDGYRRMAAFIAENAGDRPALQTSLQTMQAQMAVMALHKEFTQQQADAEWVNPGQQFLALAIDGRWQKALEVFQASWENQREIARLLQRKNPRLWRRVRAAQRVEPKRWEVKTVGALAVAASKGQKAALQWLQKQPHTDGKAIATAKAFLKTLEGAIENAEPAYANQPAPASPAPEAIALPPATRPEAVPQKIHRKCRPQKMHRRKL